MKPLGNSAHLSDQHGVAAVEFALISSLVITILLGVMETGWWLWTWNAAVDSTRFGARLAVVCRMDQALFIKQRMVERVPSLTTAQINIVYLNPPNFENTCGLANCKAVRVSLHNFTYTPLTPLFSFADLTPLLPNFSATTTLPREAMSGTNSDNEVCS